MPKSPKMRRKLSKSVCRSLFHSLPVRLVRSVRMKRGRRSMVRIFCRQFRSWALKGMVKFWSCTWISTGKVSRPPVGMWIWECWARRKTSLTVMRMTTTIWTKTKVTKTDTAFYDSFDFVVLFYFTHFFHSYLNHHSPTNTIILTSEHIQQAISKKYTKKKPNFSLNQLISFLLW